jgi:hypothetical protein
MDHRGIVGHCRRNVRNANAVCIVLAFIPGGIVFFRYQQGRRQILKALCRNRSDIGIRQVN